MNSNLPKTYSVVAVVLIIALVVAGYFVFNTFLPEYTQAKNSLDVAKQNTARLNLALSSVQTFLDNYNKQTANANRVQLALPAGGPDMPNFISSMSQIASSSGVSLSNFQISTASTDSDRSPSPYSIQSQDFGVSASGNFASFKDFLSRAESHLRLVDIYHVSVLVGNSSTDKSAESILQFQIKLHTYFQE